MRSARRPTLHLYVGQAEPHGGGGEDGFYGEVGEGLVEESVGAGAEGTPEAGVGGAEEGEGGEAEDACGKGSQDLVDGGVGGGEWAELGEEKFGDVSSGGFGGAGGEGAELGVGVEAGDVGGPGVFAVGDEGKDGVGTGEEFTGAL